MGTVNASLEECIMHSCMRVPLASAVCVHLSDHEQQLPTCDSRVRVKKAVQRPRKCCAIHAVSGWMHRSRKGPKTHAGDNNSRPRCLSASAVGAYYGVQTVDRVKEEGSEKTRCDLHDRLRQLARLWIKPSRRWGTPPRLSKQIYVFLLFGQRH